MEDEKAFALCYRSLVAYYRLTPEAASIQLAEILRRLRAINGPPNPIHYPQITYETQPGGPQSWETA